MNINTLKKQEIIRDRCIGLFNVFRKLDIEIQIYNYQRLRDYWEIRLNATDEDIYTYKANGSIRTP